MHQYSGALEQKWNEQLTRPIAPAGAKKCSLETRVAK